MKLFDDPNDYGKIPDPPSEVECTPENYDENQCYYCLNKDYCKGEYDDNMRILYVCE